MKEEIKIDKRAEFIKLIEMCMAFKEDIDYQEMQDVTMSDPNSEMYKLTFQLKTAEDKVQQMLYDEYRQNKHSTLFDQMQDAIMKSRNGNLIGGLLLMKMKQHDYDDFDKLIFACLKNRHSREMLEEVGNHNPKLLRMIEKVVSQSNNFKMINYACYIDGININKMAHAVMKLNDQEALQDFGEQHAEDLSIRTRKMLAHHYKAMEEHAIDNAMTRIRRK